MPIEPQQYDHREMSARGKKGAHTQHARHDARVTTEKARLARQASRERQVDPTGELTPEERRRRADHLMRAEMAEMTRRRWAGKRSQP